MKSWSCGPWALIHRKSALNDKEELKSLADNIKQAMYQDYKLAYSKKGEEHEEESKSTVTVA